MTTQPAVKYYGMRAHSKKNCIFWMSAFEWYILFSFERCEMILAATQMVRIKSLKCPFSNEKKKRHVRHCSTSLYFSPPVTFFHQHQHSFILFQCKRNHTLIFDENNANNAPMTKNYIFQSWFFIILQNLLVQ